MAKYFYIGLQNHECSIFMWLTIFKHVEVMLMHSQMMRQIKAMVALIPVLSAFLSCFGT